MPSKWCATGSLGVNLQGLFEHARGLRGIPLSETDACEPDIALGGLRLEFNHAFKRGAGRVPLAGFQQGNTQSMLRGCKGRIGLGQRSQLGQRRREITHFLCRHRQMQPPLAIVGLQRNGAPVRFARVVPQLVRLVHQSQITVHRRVVGIRLHARGFGADQLCNVPFQLIQIGGQSQRFYGRAARSPSPREQRGAERDHKDQDRCPPPPRGSRCRARRRGGAAGWPPR